MICDKCNKEIEENNLEESHDIPCYLWLGMNRRLQKQRADKFGRHWLCKECHKSYENAMNISLKISAVKFSNEIWRKENDRIQEV
jgi:protein-arginine kinase activator protein McsA